MLAVQESGKEKPSGRLFSVWGAIERTGFG